MDTNIIKSFKPEERELSRKRGELTALEEKLAEKELELTSLSAEMHSFETEYLSIVGTRFAKIDEIEARIAEAYARQNPMDNVAAERVAEARNRARESAKATSDIPETLPIARIKSSENLKRLYRDAAKKIHPDLCTDEKERLRREKLMSEVNRAYEEGDEERLQKLLDEWESSPETVKGEDIGAELIRILRKIAQVEERLNHINLEIENLQKTDLYKLKIQADDAAADKRDMLAEMAARLDDEIARAEKQLNEILRKKKR